MNASVTKSKLKEGRKTEPLSGWVAIFSLVLVMLAAMPINAAETGIRGTVLWGPVKPGPSRFGKSNEAPFKATFHVFFSDKEVASFKSDKRGSFEVLLVPGEYTIVPDKSTPMPVPRSQKKSVTVPEDGFAEITLHFDTGMR